MRSSYAAAGLLLAFIAMAGCSNDHSPSGSTNPGSNPSSNPSPSASTTKASEQSFKVTYEATSDGKIQSITYKVPDSADTERDFRPAVPWKKELAFTKKDSLVLTVTGSSTVNANYETKYPASSCRILVDGKELVTKTSDDTGVALCEAIME